jgi:hypothetical protein
MPDQLEAVPCPRCGEAPRLCSFLRAANGTPFYRVACGCAFDSLAHAIPDFRQAIILWNQAAVKYMEEEQHE